MSRKRQYSYSVDYASVHIEGKKLLSEFSKDIYFNPEDPIGESVHNFIAPNKLAEKFTSARSFTVAELGFGAGLNFFLTLDQWIKSKSAAGSLNYFSFEKNPISWRDLVQFYSALPEVEGFLKYLRFGDVALHSGVNTIPINEYNTILTLIIGDANEWLPELDFRADAWFLDGFAPSLNPDMWTVKLIKEISLRSVITTSLSTFSVNGNLRRELAATGWTVRKLDGFRNKREMLSAEFTGNYEIEESIASEFHNVKCESIKYGKQKIAIIGAGIAGCTLAYYLSEHNSNVTVFDDRNSTLNHASDNPFALIMPEISRQADARSLLLISAMSFLQRSFEDLGIYDDIFKPSGVVRFPTSERLKLLVADLPGLRLPEAIVRIISADEVSERIGFEAESAALLFEQSGYLSPNLLCKKYLEMCDQNLVERVVGSVEQVKGSWVLFDKLGEVIDSFDIVAIASGIGSSELCNGKTTIPFTKNYGQVLSFESELQIGKLPFCFQGYLIGENNKYCLGATYEHSDKVLCVEAVKSQLFANLAQIVGQSIVDKIDPKNLSIKGAFRAGTPDRLPYSGSLSYGSLDSHSSLFLHSNFGSRGFTLTPLLSWDLARRITGKASALDWRLLHAVSPQRYTPHIFKKNWRGKETS